MAKKKAPARRYIVDFHVPLRILFRGKYYWQYGQRGEYWRELRRVKEEAKGLIAKGYKVHIMKLYDRPFPPKYCVYTNPEYDARKAIDYGKRK